MEMRIFFVGMNNKPGLAPLCSSTRSGKLIDRITRCVPYTCIKTNLFDSNEWENRPYNTAVVDWITRVDYHTGDIIISLGACVHEYFRRALHYRDLYKETHIELGHPSAVWSKVKQDEYITYALLKIRALCSE